MDSFLEGKKEKQGNSKVLIGAILIAFVVVAALVGLVALRPSKEEAQKEVLAGAFREGSPEFAVLTRKIIAQTDENRTTQSPTAMGTIVMSIGGIIRNITGKTLTGLELKVAVVDLSNNVVKEKLITVIPNQLESLGNNQTMNVQVPIDGFAKDDDRANIRWKVTAIKTE